MATATKAKPHVREARPDPRIVAHEDKIFWSDEEKILVVQRGIENRLKGMTFGGAPGEMAEAQKVLPENRRRPINRSATSTFEAILAAIRMGEEEARSQPGPEPEPGPATRPNAKGGTTARTDGKRRVYWTNDEKKAIVAEAVRLTLTGGQRGAKSLLASAMLVLPEDRQRDPAAVPAAYLDWFHDGIRIGVSEARAEEVRAKVDLERQAEEARLAEERKRLDCERDRLAREAAELDKARLEKAERWWETGITVATVASPACADVGQLGGHHPSMGMGLEGLLDRFANLIDGRERTSVLLIRIAAGLFDRVERLEAERQLDRASLMKLASDLGIGSEVPGTGFRTPAPLNGRHPANGHVKGERVKVLVVGLQQHLHQRIATPYAKYAYVKVIQEPGVAITSDLSGITEVFYADRIKPDHLDRLKGALPLANFHQLTNSSMDRVRLDMDRALDKYSK